MTPAASPPKASPARGQPSSWGRRRVRLSRPPGGLGPRANPRLQRSWRFGDYQVAAHLIIPARWTPWPPLELMFAGLRRRREAIRERETERDRLAEGWTPSRSPDEPQSSR